MLCAQSERWARRRARPLTIQMPSLRRKRSPGDITTGRVRLASKSIFFIKKQGRSIYIDDDDREIM